MGASIALGVTIMHDNIMKAPTRLESAKRAGVCTQAFSLTFFLLNYRIVLAPRHATILSWGNAGEGTRAVIWGILSCLLSLWMAIWVSTLFTTIPTGAGREGSGDERREARSARNEEVMTAAREAALHIAETSMWSDARNSDEEASCPICMEPFESHCVVRTTQCRHVFCSACLGAFIAGTSAPGLLACPMCRTTLSERQLRDPLTSSVANASSGTATPAIFIDEP